MTSCRTARPGRAASTWTPCNGPSATGRQVGFARVITDQATFAYLVDVFVLETHRGQGVSRRLMEAVMACPALARLRRFTLVTSTAAGLYARFGFTPLHAPQAHMEILRPDVYRQG
ncbi:GNAT family N-acetyltransferase [Cupriavidus sp. USMAHM13]|uniref:GNAT family N-acetyltransferase n=1 Tax=Cupriavidus sp. USMAHM13 TaxID=1389192 RepID=UPI000A40B23E